MSVDVGNTSRLLFAELLSLDEVEFWDTLVLPDAGTRQDDIQHIVANSDRIDLLAQMYYQEASLWWVIAWANNLEILPTDLKEGDQIRIPSTDYVQNVLLRRVRTST
jgi:hypothetical protein